MSVCLHESFAKRPCMTAFTVHTIAQVSITFAVQKHELTFRCDFFMFPGKQFAYQEMRLLLATIVSRWDIKPAPGFDGDAFEASWEDRTITDLLGKFNVVMTPRQ